MTDIMKIDLYLLLEIESTATDQEIKKAYRKKALTCHPDKHPDNPQATELFRQLSKALEILTDSSARDAYDKLLRARKASRVRHRELDSKRKKLKDDLEAREKAAKDEVESEAEASAKLSAEIERLRKEGSKQLEKENELLKKQIQEEIRLRQQKLPKLPKLKVKPKLKKTEFNESIIRNHFSKFGEISCLVVSKKTAILEFAHAKSSHDCLENTNEYFNVELIKEGNQNENDDKKESLKTESIFTFNTATSTTSNLINDSDYENLVLRKLRQAEERKNLIKQLEQEES